MVEGYEELVKSLLEKEVTSPDESIQDPKRNAIASLIPMAAGVLTGQVGQGAQLGLNAYKTMEDQRSKSRGKLLDYLAKVGKKSGSGQDSVYFQDILDEQGNPIKQAYKKSDLLSGNVKPMEIGVSQAKGAPVETVEAGLKTPAQIQVSADPLTKKSSQRPFRDSPIGQTGTGDVIVGEYDEKGNLINTRLVKTGKQQTVTLSDNSSFTPTQNQDKELNNYAEEFRKIKKATDTDIMELSSGLKELEKGSQLGSKLAVMRLVKQVEQRLSDRDRDYYATDISLLNRLGVMIEQNVDNKLNPRLVTEAKDLIKNSISRLGNYSNKKAIDYAKSLKSKNIPVEYSMSVMHPELYEKAKSKARK